MADEFYAMAALTILPEHLDRRANLLNTPNGTVELGTETLREHRRQDYITKITAASERCLLL